MADVYCKKCGEPWDTYHLRHDEVWETGLRDTLCKVFPGKLTPMYRKAFESIGWRFGHSIFNIYQCPCCKDKDIQLEETEDLELVVEQVLGDDLDAIQIEIEDLQN